MLLSDARQIGRVSLPLYLSMVAVSLSAHHPQGDPQPRQAVPGRRNRHDRPDRPDRPDRSDRSPVVTSGTTAWNWRSGRP